MDRYYWPYDELKLELEGDQLVLSTPWLTASISSSKLNPDSLAQLVEKSKTGSFGVQDAGLLTALLRGFQGYPIAYILPQSSLHATLDEHKLQDDSLQDLAMEEYLDKATGHTFGDLKPLPTRREWTWDLEAALAFSKIEDGKHHPESLFSVARRFHLLEVMENHHGDKVFDEVKSLADSQFRDAAAIIVRQNHYVTQCCEPSLTPAVEIAGHARADIEEFIREERGHDLILGSAMKALDKDPNEVPVAAQTRIIMELLKYAAGRNLLAFAFIVDAFERSSYQKVDPLAQLLSHGGFEKAANSINRHMQINDAGGHENVALSFLKHMAPVNEAYTQEALRCAELATLMMNSVTSAALELYRSSSR